MSLTGALAAGAVLGARHALEADHVAAIATLVSDDEGRTGFVGASWGVGHSLPVVALGLLFVALGIRLPEHVTVAFEAVVGAVLIGLGARMLWQLVARTGVDMEMHEHDESPHSHLRVGKIGLGLDHHHLDSASFLVGVVHGLAGSGVLVIALVTTAPSVGTALWFLAGFSTLSVLTMAAVSAVWGRALAAGATRYLEGLAGLVSVVVGVALLVGQAGSLVL